MEFNGHAIGLPKGHRAAALPATLPPLASFPTTAPAPRASAATSSSPQTLQDPHVPRLLPVSPTSTVSRTSSPRSSPRTTSAPMPFRIVYPLLPSMDPRELPHFQKGAQIALDNILDDYLGNPEMNLLEVIADLEDERPVVGVVKEDWGRRCMVEGAIWVGEAVARWWEDWFGEAEDSDEEDWEDDAGNSDEGNDEYVDESAKDVVFGTVGGVGEVDRTGQGRDTFPVEDEVEQPEAGRFMNEHGLGNANFDDTSTAQQEVVQAADEDGAVRDKTVYEGPRVDPIISPLDNVNNGNDITSDGAGTVEAIYGGQSDGEERGQDAKEARLIACMLKLVGRWIELQVEHAAKTGQADR